MKMIVRRHLATFAIMLVILPILHGCYTFNGATLDYNVYRTIAFGSFPIRAALVYPPLQQLFENKLRDKIQQTTRLKTVDGNNADVQIEGEITGFDLSPQAVGENAYATRTRLTITVHVRYTDNRNSALTKDQTFSAYRDFDSNQMLVDVQDELCNQICNDLTDLIYNSTLGNW